MLDFAWALCDIVERVDRDPAGSRASRPQHAELDFTESTDRLLFERRFGWVDIEAEWLPAAEPPLTFSHAELRREARDFLHDLLADRDRPARRPRREPGDLDPPGPLPPRELTTPGPGAALSGQAASIRPISSRASAVRLWSGPRTARQAS